MEKPEKLEMNDWIAFGEMIRYTIKKELSEKQDEIGARDEAGNATDDEKRLCATEIEAFNTGFDLLGDLTNPKVTRIELIALCLGLAGSFTLPQYEGEGINNDVIKAQSDMFKRFAEIASLDENWNMGIEKGKKFVEKKNEMLEAVSKVMDAMSVFAPNDEEN